MQLSKMRARCSLVPVCLLWIWSFSPDVLFAQETTASERAAVEIISIEHRDPMFIRAQLTSLLDPRGNIGLVDNKLIISSTAGNLQQLKNLISDADVPARRLVVSVDFEYGNLRPANAGQQSSQALEGDTVSFSDSTLTEFTDAAFLPPRVVINSSVRGDVVEADVELFNVPGFSGRHPLSLMLGQWYVINPDTDTDTDTDSELTVDQQSDFEIFSELPVSEAEQMLTVPAESSALSAPIAVRVDVLP